MASRRPGLGREQQLDTSASNEHALEVDVSRYIRDLPFLWLAVVDEPGPTSLRAVIETNTVALLSNAGRPALDTRPRCGPSSRFVVSFETALRSAGSPCASGRPLPRFGAASFGVASRPICPSLPLTAGSRNCSPGEQ
jgi:hypothetical protein